MIKAIINLSIGNLTATGGAGGAGGTGGGIHGPPISLTIASPKEYAKLSSTVALPKEYEPSFTTVAFPSDFSTA